MLFTVITRLKAFIQKLVTPIDSTLPPNTIKGTSSHCYPVRNLCLDGISLSRVVIETRDRDTVEMVLSGTDKAINNIAINCSSTTLTIRDKKPRTVIVSRSQDKRLFGADIDVTALEDLPEAKFKIPRDAMLTIKTTCGVYSIGAIGGRAVIDLDGVAEAIVAQLSVGQIVVSGCAKLEVAALGESITSVEGRENGEIEIFGLVTRIPLRLASFDVSKILVKTLSSSEPINVTAKSGKITINSLRSLREVICETHGVGQVTINDASCLGIRAVADGASKISFGGIVHNNPDFVSEARAEGVAKIWISKAERRDQIRTAESFPGKVRID